MSIEIKPRELILTRIIGAPRPVVWRCWTDPVLLMEWYCPRPWRVTDADFDLRPGGRMNMVMHGPNGERHELIGICLENIPEERLTFTDSYSEGFVPREKSFMTGYVRLADAGAGNTRMVWGARHANEEATKSHLAMGFEQGWSAAADQLDALARRLAG
jgi:uncharacterized protein YndB with AHSA1/START domain